MFCKACGSELNFVGMGSNGAENYDCSNCLESLVVESATKYYVNVSFHEGKVNGGSFTKVGNYLNVSFGLDIDFTTFRGCVRNLVRQYIEYHDLSIAMHEVVYRFNTGMADMLPKEYRNILDVFTISAKEEEEYSIASFKVNPQETAKVEPIELVSEVIEDVEEVVMYLKRSIYNLHKGTAVVERKVNIYDGLRDGESYWVKDYAAKDVDADIYKIHETCLSTTRIYVPCKRKMTELMPVVSVVFEPVLYGNAFSYYFKPMEDGRVKLTITLNPYDHTERCVPDALNAVMDFILCSNKLLEKSKETKTTYDWVTRFPILL